MQDPAAIATLLGLARGYRLSEVVLTAARLGVPDAIAGGATTVEAVASETGTHAPTLARLLRILAAAGVLHDLGDGSFALTSVGEAMRTDAPGSVAPWLALLDRDYVREAWRHLEDSVRTGEGAFEALHGEDVWTWRGARPKEAAIFDRAMTAQSDGVGAAVAAAFDFRGASTIADIAGGAGALLAGVLRGHPHLHGILFDQPSVIDGPLALRAPDLEGRYDVVGGSFFDAVPGGAQVYLMKAILHDWDDPDAVRILRNIGAVMPPSGALLVVERVIGPANEDVDGRLSDLHMLVMLGARERDREGWAALLASGGFRIDDVRPLRGPWQLIVSTPAVAS